MKTQESNKKPEQETAGRNTPRGEDPARLNDLNSDNKPAPPQPKVGDTPAQTQPTDKADDAPAPTEKGQHPNQTIADKPTNPPHIATDGTLWATENTTEKK